MANVQDALREWLDHSKERGEEAPKPGRIARRKKHERAQLLKQIKALAEGVDNIDERLQRIEREIDERVDHANAWERFAELTGVATQAGGHKTHHC